MIRNSVTHLWSYTNSAIAGNSAPISPDTLREHRCLASVADIVALNGECFVMFHNVLRVFHDVLLMVHDVLQRLTMYHNVLQVFHDVLLCLTMFYDV